MTFRCKNSRVRVICETCLSTSPAEWRCVSREGFARQQRWEKENRDEGMVKSLLQWVGRTQTVCSIKEWCEPRLRVVTVIESNLCFSNSVRRRTCKG